MRLLHCNELELPSFVQIMSNGCRTNVTLKCMIQHGRFFLSFQLTEPHPSDSMIFYIYIYITNCRQYCFGLLGLISAVLMSRMEVKLKKPPQMSHTCGTSKPCQSAQTSELASVRNIYIYIYISDWIYEYMASVSV